MERLPLIHRWGNDQNLHRMKDSRGVKYIPFTKIAYLEVIDSDSDRDWEIHEYSASSPSPPLAWEDRFSEQGATVYRTYDRDLPRERPSRNRESRRFQNEVERSRPHRSTSNDRRFRTELDRGRRPRSSSHEPTGSRFRKDFDREPRHRSSSYERDGPRYRTSYDRNEPARNIPFNRNEPSIRIVYDNYLQRDRDNRDLISENGHDFPIVGVERERNGPILRAPQDLDIPLVRHAYDRDVSPRRPAYERYFPNLRADYDRDGSIHGRIHDFEIPRPVFSPKSTSSYKQRILTVREPRVVRPKPVRERVVQSSNNTSSHRAPRANGSESTLPASRSKFRYKNCDFYPPKPDGDGLIAKKRRLIKEAIASTDPSFEFLGRESFNPGGKVRSNPIFLPGRSNSRPGTPTIPDKAYFQTIKPSYLEPQKQSPTPPPLPERHYHDIDLEPSRSAVSAFTPFEGQIASRNRTPVLAQWQDTLTKGRRHIFLESTQRLYNIEENPDY